MISAKQILSCPCGRLGERQPVLNGHIPVHIPGISSEEWLRSEDKSLTHADPEQWQMVAEGQWIDWCHSE